MHRLLLRQLRKNLGTEEVPEGMEDLIASIDRVYRQADADRSLLERSLDLTSDELLERNAQLQRDREALRESHRRNEAILDALPDLVLAIADDGTILDERARSVGHHPYAPPRTAEVVTISEIWPPALASTCLVKVREALDSADPVHWEYQLAAEGSVYYFEARLVRRDASRVIAIIRDVSELKSAQETLLSTDRLVAMGTIAAGVAHELNNPLTYVLANLEEANRSRYESLATTWPELAEALREAWLGARRLQDVVGDLKALTQPDLVKIVPVDIHKVLNAAANIATAEIKHRAQLVRDYGPVPPVLGNESKLGQVFLNLLVNAAQALPIGDAGSHRITIRTRSGGDFVRLAIEDTGPGIPPDVRSRLFEPFFTTKPQGVGTGLGLAICRSIVTALRGEITVEQPSGGGTRFVVRLPAAALPAPRDPTAPTPLVPMRRARVLVIDDEPLVGRAIQRILRGHMVFHVRTGREGIERVVSEPFDVVLCDLMMPEVSGMDVFAAVEAHDPTLLRRFIFMTGGAFDDAARTFLARIPNRALEKPFASARLRDAIASHLPDL